jgi:hypothetical protein
MDTNRRTELIAQAIEAGQKLYTVDDIVELTRRPRQNVERLIRSQKINALVDTDTTKTSKYLVTARQVAALLRTDHYQRPRFVPGTPLDEAREEARQRIEAKRRTHAMLTGAKK